MKERTAFIFILIYILLACSCLESRKYRYTVRIDEIPLIQIINPYGSPLKNHSFTGDSLRINNHVYEHGIGTHAPSDLSIFVDRKDAIFEAYIGIDVTIRNYRDAEQIIISGKHPSYIYDGIGDLSDFNQGGTAIFRIFADNNLIYESPVLNSGDQPVKVRLKIKNTRIIRLVTDPGDDGSFADHTNWALARFIFNEDIHPASLYTFTSPRDIMLNQAGYKPSCNKKCVMPSDVIDSIYIYNYLTNKLAFKNTIDLISNDLGKYLTADFSSLTEPGSYYILSAGRQSGVFEIREDILTDQLISHLNFVKTLRVNSQELIPGHDAAEGRTTPDDQGKSVPEGWFDIYTHRWSASSTAQLLFSMSVCKEHNDNSELDSLISREVMGISRFLPFLQENEGYIISHVDLKHPELISSGTQPLKESRPNAIQFSDRSPAEITTQFIFSMAHARLAGLYRDSDPAMALKLAVSAERSYHWACRHFTAKNPDNLGAAIGAACDLYKYSGNPAYDKDASSFAKELLEYADTSDIYPSGLFLSSPVSLSEAEELSICTSVWPVAGLCFYAETFPGRIHADACRKLIDNYCTNFLQYLSSHNAFDLVPFGIYKENIPGRRIADNYFYTLFNADTTAFPSRGNISQISFTGAILLMASEITGNSEFKIIAQRQLDWILGCNPFNLSFITGIGYHHPARYMEPGNNLSIRGIRGGVMSGLTNGGSDYPAVFPGWKQTTAYCVEAVANTIWLTSLLNR